MRDHDEDYVTVAPTADPSRFLVVVMKYHLDEYVQTKVSQPLSRVAADALAKSWALALGVEIR